MRVFLVITHSVVGGLPLGILILSYETTPTLVAGFTHLKVCMGEGSFYSQLYPSVIMIDNCSELRSALRLVWPGARLLLCIFHILQQIWRWLHEKKNEVNLFHRPLLLQMMKSILYAPDAETLDRLVGRFVVQ